MTLSEELSKNKDERKRIVHGYMQELLNSYTIIEGYEAVYGTDATNFPEGVHTEVMELIARATEIHSHIPALKKSVEMDRVFQNVTSEIDIMLNS
jgi:hypothetical protein